MLKCFYVAHLYAGGNRFHAVVLTNQGWLRFYVKPPELGPMWPWMTLNDPAKIYTKFYIWEILSSGIQHISTNWLFKPLFRAFTRKMTSLVSPAYYPADRFWILNVSKLFHTTILRSNIYILFKGHMWIKAAKTNLWSVDMFSNLAVSLKDTSCSEHAAYNCLYQQGSSILNYFKLQHSCFSLFVQYTSFAPCCCIVIGWV